MSDKLKRVITLAELLAKQQRELKELELEVKERKTAMLRTEREDLPELMKELGLSELKLTDGSIVKIKDEVDASISKSNPYPALKWLLEHDFGGLIKTEVSLIFGKGEHDEAAAATVAISEMGYSPDLKEAVHPATLKAFVKEQLKEGGTVPFDLFNVYPYSKATITRSK
jgi:hypothetical protein